MKLKSTITTLDQLLDTKYGQRGMPEREDWEKIFEAFRLGVLQENKNNKKNGKDAKDPDSK